MLCETIISFRLCAVPHGCNLRLSSKISGDGNPGAEIFCVLSCSMQMLKRRSTVLDEGWTSGGPIRRTRHKAIVSITPSNLTQSRGLVFPATPYPSASLLTLASPIGGKRGEGTPAQRNAVASPPKEKNTLTASGNFYVPAQSSETARKILETLEKMTPSPKGKSLGDELAYVRDRPPTALTEGMLNDQARKSMSFVDFPSASDAREPGPSGRIAEEDPLNFSFRTPDSGTKVKGKGKAPLPPTENGPGVQGGLLATQERISTADGSFKQTTVRPKEPVAVIASESDKSKGFRMSAVFEVSHFSTSLYRLVCLDHILGGKHCRRVTVSSHPSYFLSGST